ncbi:MAG: hypothetical protein C5B53_00730 [Candidatus Melainabacteria bacterium]|nr:MAG: hypothetical protein C5B53_00730 [Candidatus Melainabacteria bacterium]
MRENKLTDAMVSTDHETQIWKSRFQLAKAACESGKYKEAEGLLYKALEQAHNLTEHVFATNTCLVGLAVVYFLLGKPDEAAKQVEEAMRALSRADEPALKELYGVALRIHAELLCDSGKVTAASDELEKAALALESIGMQGAVQLAYVLSDLAMLRVQQGELNEAKQLIYSAMDLLPGPPSSDKSEYLRADMIYNICQTTDQKEMLSELENRITKMQYHLGQKHPNVIRAVRWYLKKLYEQGDTEQLREAEVKFGIGKKK